MKVKYKMYIEVDLDDTKAENGTLQKSFSNEMEKVLNIVNSTVMDKWYTKEVKSNLQVSDDNDDYFTIKQLKYSKDN